MILLSEEIKLRVVRHFDSKQMSRKEKRELNRILESQRLANEREEIEMRKHYDIVYKREAYDINNQVDPYATVPTIRRGDKLVTIPPSNIGLL